MRNVWLLVFIWMLMTFSFASVTRTETDTLNLYAYNVENEFTRTKVYFEHVLTISTSREYAPYAEDPNDLGDDDLICPGAPLEIHVMSKAMFAKDGNWESSYTTPFGDPWCVDDSSLSPSEHNFMFNSDIYSEYHDKGELATTDFSLLDGGVYLPVSVKLNNPQCCCGSGSGGDVVQQKMKVNGVIDPYLALIIRDRTVEERVEGSEISYDYIPTEEGNLEVKSNFNINGVLLIQGRSSSIVGCDCGGDSIYDRLVFRSRLDNPNGEEYSVSLPEAIITLRVVNLSASMSFSDVSPSTIESFPTELVVTLYNDGTVPVKVVGVEASDDCISVSPLGGFNEEVEPQNNIILHVNVDKACDPVPETFTLTFNYEAVGGVCEGANDHGEVSTSDINVGIQSNFNTSIDAPDEVNFGETFTATYVVESLSQSGDIQNTRTASGGSNSYEETESVHVSPSAPFTLEKTFTCDDVGGINLTSSIDTSGYQDDNPDDNYAEKVVRCVGNPDVWAGISGPDEVTYGDTFNVTFIVNSNIEQTHTVESIRNITNSTESLYGETSNIMVSSMTPGTVTVEVVCNDMNGIDIIHRINPNPSIDSDSSNNIATHHVTCTEPKYCVLTPDSIFLLPGQTKTGSIMCGTNVCDRASVVNTLTSFAVKFGPSHSYVNEYDATAFPSPSEVSEQAEIQAVANGNIYTCTLDLSLGVPDCIDFI